MNLFKKDNVQLIQYKIEKEKYKLSKTLLYKFYNLSNIIEYSQNTQKKYISNVNFCYFTKYDKKD